MSWRPKHQHSDNISDSRPFHANPRSGASMRDISHNDIQHSSDCDSSRRGGSHRFPRNARNSGRQDHSSRRRRNGRNGSKTLAPPTGRGSGHGRRRPRSRGRASGGSRHSLRDSSPRERLFAVGDYVMISSNGRVGAATVIDFSKSGAYVVEFKTNGKKAYYREGRMSKVAMRISSEQYDDASEASASIRSPTPDLTEAKEIELITEPGASAPDEQSEAFQSNNQEKAPVITTRDSTVAEEDDVAEAVMVEASEEVEEQFAGAFDMNSTVPTPHPSPAPSASIRTPAPDLAEAKEIELITEPGAAAPDEVDDVAEDDQFEGSQSSNNQQEPSPITTSDTAVQAHSAGRGIAATSIEEAKEANAQSEPFKIHKRPKDSAKKAKKSEMQQKWHRLGSKVKDKRERAFVAMCGSRHDQLQLQQLNSFIVEIGGVTASRAQKLTVKRFFKSMNPNGNNRVSFSNFVKTIDDNGDVIKAYRRFKKK